MKNELAKTAFAALGLAITLFLSCSDYQPMEFPSLEEVQQMYPSSSNVSSSSSGESSSSSGESSSSSRPSSSSSCAYPDKCNGVCYDKTKQFCYSNSKLGDFCGINPQKSYDPDLYECKTGKNGIYLKAGVTDNKDGGKYYNAVLMGSQVWMAENMNYKSPNGTSRCYAASGDEDNSNCNKYGRLYNWATAIDISLSYNSNLYSASQSQGVCPSGWHIPSKENWVALMKFVNPDCDDFNATFCDGAGTKLKSASEWSPAGTDDYGFAALPSGLCMPNGNCIAINIMSGWWSTLQYSQDYSYAFDWYTPNNYPEEIHWFYDEKEALISVRCVKN